MGYDRYDDTRSMWSSINLTMSTKAHAVKPNASCSLLMCQAADLAPLGYRGRSTSPTLSQAYHFMRHKPLMQRSLQRSDSPSYSSRPMRPAVFEAKSLSSSWSSKSSTKSCLKTVSSDSNSGSRRVSFDFIEVKEHPRILGDNPSPKKGPALSIGWFKPSIGRVIRYSVDEYEKIRSPMRLEYAQALAPSVRQRMLMQEAGVTPMEMFAARKEASLIRRSRRDHSALAQYDDTAIVVESCVRTVKRFLTGSVSEWELRELMQQAERAKLSQQ